MDRRFVFRPVFVALSFLGLFFLFYAFAIFQKLGLFQKTEHWIQAGFCAVALICIAGAGFVGSHIMRTRPTSTTWWETLWAYYAVLSILGAVTMIAMAFDVRQFDGPTIEVGIASLTMAFQVAALICWFGFGKMKQEHSAKTEIVSDA